MRDRPHSMRDGPSAFAEYAVAIANVGVPTVATAFDSYGIFVRKNKNQRVVAGGAVR